MMPIPWELQQLADWYGAEQWYYDDRGQRTEATEEALLTILGILGAPLKRVEEADDALRHRQQEMWQRVLEPVFIAWDGWPGDITLKLPNHNAGAGKLECRLAIENGRTHEWSVALDTLPVREAAEVEGVAYTVRALSLVGPLPLGYHQFSVRRGSAMWETVIIAAPVQSYSPESGIGRTWGVFLPAYAIRSARNWGAGDLTDLENLIRWVQGMGGGLVGTLPLNAAFLDERCEPSPYSPASRLFWNEFYVDPTRAAEFTRCREAKAFIASSEFRQLCEAAKEEPLIDYQPLAKAKRHVLELLAQNLPARSARRTAFDTYVKTHPRAEDYARFRAAGERAGVAWCNWPERMREGDIRPGDYDEAARHYHLYVQFVASEQLATLATTARKTGPGLYLDLPLGVNADGYDVWRERRVFALGVSGGAPPDSFFSKGQDWGFPALHPERLRDQGYRYLRDCLHHHMGLAGMLRIDHMMGLHRLYWVPRELGPRNGVYVRYPAEELYAVYSLESVRHKTLLVGEDLGTVPPQVRPAMERHQIRRLYVGQYEARPDPSQPFVPAPAGAVASMNTHDMPTFTAFWRELDVADRLEMGLFDEAGAEAERVRRAAIREAIIASLREAGFLSEEEEPDEASVLRGCMQWIASGDSAFVLVSLEDIWQEAEPQNVPGTWKEKPNWRRRAAHALEELDEVPGVRETLLAVDQVQRNGGGGAKKVINEPRPSEKRASAP
jgi:4-alpha-glucanotransferase